MYTAINERCVPFPSCDFVSFVVSDSPDRHGSNLTETLNEDRENEKATRQLGGLFFKGE